MAQIYQAHHLAKNVEYVAFEQNRQGIKSLVLVKPESVQNYASATGQAVVKVYWKNGKWSKGFASEFPGRPNCAAALWIGSNSAEGLKLFDFACPNAEEVVS